MDLVITPAKCDEEFFRWLPTHYQDELCMQAWDQFIYARNENGIAPSIYFDCTIWDEDRGDHCHVQMVAYERGTI